MENPYIERVAARMRADDARSQLQRHWSVRLYRSVHWIGYWLDRLGLERLSTWYGRATEPVTDWLSHRQAIFLRRWL